MTSHRQPSALRVFSACFLLSLCASAAPAQRPVAQPDPIATMVGRLNLERYKATIKGLTQFGDRRQGTERNRAAIDWIEAQLKSYGCTNTERIKYDYQPPPPPAPPHRRPAARRPHCRPRRLAQARRSSCPTTVNNDPMKQPDVKLRELDSQPSTPGAARRGLLHQDRRHASGRDVHRRGPHGRHRMGRSRQRRRLRHRAGDGDRARLLSSPDVATDRSIRFALWNNEETGLNGARAYVDQRKDSAGQGISGRIGQISGAEMAGHDPARHDDVRPRHAAQGRHRERSSSVPKPTSTSSSRSHRSSPTMPCALACKFQLANEKYATDYPANVGPHMTNTDSTPFMDLTPSLSLREIERGSQIGTGWDPQSPSAHRRLLPLHRRRFPPRPECHANHARRHRPADRGEAHFGPIRKRDHILMAVPPAYCSLHHTKAA